MSRKGISPVISSVLVLAVALAVAGVFSSWGPQIADTVTDSTTNTTDKTTFCNKADLEITEAKYYSSSNEVSIVVRNKGTEQLNRSYVSAWNSNGLPMNESAEFVLSRGNYTTQNVTATSEPAEVKVFSKRCGSVTETFEDIS